MTMNREQDTARAAYLISGVETLDKELGQRYGALAATSIAAYDGRYLVRGAAPEVVEGEWPAGQRIVVAEFPAIERLQQWYASPDYAEALTISQDAIKRTLLFVEGLPATQA